ncbi:MAG: arginine--tRNA ligase [Lactobacillaceae bacterium]|jgi:arginyl-tRNA synthetase|nr:arginine--tRNA ligase [Lactobacillaceae bacterium]
MKIVENIAQIIYDSLSQGMTIEEITSLIEKPKNLENGDYAFPVFKIAKHVKRNPNEIATELAFRIDLTKFDKIEAKGPYVNFYLKKDRIASQLITEINNSSRYGFNEVGRDKTILIDLSSPNIAKPMSMGHLRSTVIGNAIANLATANGYKTVKINHLGDWGTQFGLMIAAYKKWGNNKSIENYSIDELVKLYVDINNAAKENPKIAEEGRAWFKKLEENDDEAISLWTIIRKQSLIEFFEIYDRLGISFDSTNGEAFYNDKMQNIVTLLENKKLLTKSQGAEIVDLPKLLPDSNLPIAMIKRSDGATLYITRDLAAAVYRKHEYEFDKAFYVVGAEQKTHFLQLKAILKLADFDWSDDIEHISFGLITLGGSKMSSRKGNTIALVDVLNTAHNLALQQINIKNPDLLNANDIAEEVGVGAVIFNDLMNDRKLSIDFNLDDIVRFEGDTGPYVQYTNARIHSILKKSTGYQKNDNNVLNDDKTWPIISKMLDFPNVIKKAFDQRDPSQIAKYILQLSREFNSYYANTKILVEDENLNARLGLITSVSKIIETSLKLLGIKAPNEM